MPRKSDIFLETEQIEKPFGFLKSALSLSKMNGKEDEEEDGNAKVLFSIAYDWVADFERSVSTEGFKTEHLGNNNSFNSGFLSLLCQLLSQPEYESYIIYCHKNERIYIQDSFRFESYVLQEHNIFFKARLFVLFNRQMHVRGFIEAVVSPPNKNPNLIIYKHKCNKLMSLIGASLIQKSNCCSLHPQVNEEDLSLFC